MIANVNRQDDMGISEEERRIGQPILLILCSKAYVAIPELQEENTRPYVKDLRVKTLDSAR